jgi:hypothetical protein
VQSHSRKPCRIAEEEIQAGMVKWEVPQPGQTPLETASEVLDGVIGGEADD